MLHTMIHLLGVTDYMNGASGGTDVALLPGTYTAAEEYPGGQGLAATNRRFILESMPPAIPLNR
jgi:hypothetical protein